MKLNNTIAWGMAAPLIAGAAALVLVLAGCGSSPDSTPKPAVSGSSPDSAPKPAASGRADELDEAIRAASTYLNGRVPKGSKTVFLNFRSDYPDLSEYILSGLSENAVNDGVFNVVDRQQLEAIRAELHFQMSGEVSDESAQSIGQMLGAQSIVSGAVSKVGPLYRIQVKAITVQTAGVQGQWSRNVPNGATIAALTERYVPAGSTAQKPSPGTSTAQSGGAAPGGASQGTGQQASGGAAPSAPPPPPAPPASASPQTQPAVGAAMTKAGLYAGSAFQGAMDLYGIQDWLIAHAQEGGNYTIVLDKDQAVTPTEFSYDRKTVSITLKTAGGKHTVKFASSSPAYSLFTVGARVTFTLEEGITLEGAKNDADKSIVRVAGGVFVMKGGTLTGNKTTGGGGGVRVDSGAFTMNGGTISGNSSSSGGGVFVASGTFAMSGGNINGNSSSSGGGVYVKGTFTMSGGTISGNSVSRVYSSSYGGGVYGEGAFTMSGGTISGNSSSSFYEGGGGGVWVKGTFTMYNGAISGNSTNRSGGGVYVTGKFIKSGGVIHGPDAQDEWQANKANNDSLGHAVAVGNDSGSISKKRNITARETLAMDSDKNGPSGGWE